MYLKTEKNEAIASLQDDVFEILPDTEVLNRVSTYHDALVLLKNYEKNAGWLLRSQKIMQLLAYVDQDNEVDLHYKPADRRPSFCLDINWKLGQVSVYEETEELGRGSGGIVRKFSSSNGQAIAVKKSPKKGMWLVDSETDLETSILKDKKENYFIQKAYNVKNYCKFFDWRHRLHYATRIVMPIIHGKKAYEVFRAVISEHQVAMLIQKLTEALIVLHEEKGMIHGDIKEDNILIFEDGAKIEVKFVDFGLSYELTDLKATVTTDDSEYWAPERIRPKGVLLPNTNQDVYSFGSLLIRILYKHAPESITSALMITFPSIDKFIQASQNPNPESRPMLRFFYEALCLEQSRGLFQSI